jgi:DNA (cytosine-5)-methyltransferase 1
MAYEWEAVVVGAWAVGAPHKRERVWIVGRLEHAEKPGISRQQHRRLATSGETEDQRETDNNGVDRPGASGRSEAPGAVSSVRREAVADASGSERTESGKPTGWTQPTAAPVRCRWPSRPGEPQHSWEAPRLVEFGLGGPALGMARRIHERLDGSGNGISPDRAASRANKTLLRMCGNSWVFPLARLMFELIVELDGDGFNAKT